MIVNEFTMDITTVPDESATQTRHSVILRVKDLSFTQRCQIIWSILVEGKFVLEGKM